MLTAHVERYVALRRALGFKLRDVARDLRAYARYAEARGDACVRLRTAADWAEQAPSPRARHRSWCANPPGSRPRSRPTPRSVSA